MVLFSVNETVEIDLAPLLPVLFSCWKIVEVGLTLFSPIFSPKLVLFSAGESTESRFGASTKKKLHANGSPKLYFIAKFFDEK